MYTNSELTWTKFIRILRVVCVVVSWNSISEAQVR